MFMGTNKQVTHEMIHWMWLWMLAAIVISSLQTVAFGDQGPPLNASDYRGFDSEVQPFAQPRGLQTEARFNPYGIEQTKNVTLVDMLSLNRQGKFDRVIKVWQQLDISRESVAWKHVGIGVAHLRQEQLDEAREQFNRALACDPDNAVAEYFLGRVCHAKCRKTPFWYEKDDESPFRLIAVHAPQASTTAVATSNASQELDRGKALLPHLKKVTLEKQAKQHYRNAIRLAPRCDLNQPIDVVVPRVRLAANDPQHSVVTVLDLLTSLEEDDYLEKSKLEARERFVSGTLH